MLPNTPPRTDPTLDPWAAGDSGPKNEFFC